jgi:hypothetical protein
MVYSLYVSFACEPCDWLQMTIVCWLLLFLSSVLLAASC